jgi:DNA-binding NtrC family response regulator
VRKGTFREDLYYRLRVVEVELPPLRERVEDVPTLVDRFLAQIADRLGRDKKQIAPDALTRLARHGWPGNVRELRNVIEQAAVLSSGPCVGEDDLRLDLAPPGATASGDAALAGACFSEAKKRTVETFERRFLLEALRANGGNVSRTAEAIGMVRQSLQQKIRELGLRAEDWSRDA